ncbi:potassium voltage-gated channel protein Shaw [Elysia marginata]|uniref:Potassium voltage-gated channel protein Shaw n=1 Tax=Elysia marginata TaxID=1093978 RepID=A0AAV4GVQ0_9GAST|nr:potassium voltage-gated channel protein Shaw [Elysia marginata]
MQTLTSLKQLEIDRNPSYMRHTDVTDDTRRSCHVTRLKLWKLLTDPSDSKAAKVYAYISLVFVLLAIFSFCASTHELFDVSDSSGNKSTTGPTSDQILNSNASSDAHLGTTEVTQTTTPRQFQEQWRDSFSSRMHPALFYIDIICLVFFTVEYLVKLVCATPRCQFVKSITAVFDLLAILPDYVELMLFFFFPQLLASENTAIIDFMPFLRLMRAFRIFRLIRRVPGLWIMMYTLRASFKELSLMLVFLLVGTLLFASVIFFVDDPKVFTSIPHGFWWAIVTMTTVGYGDMAPVTAWGQIVGSVTAICGVLIVGFTIPSLVNNFITYYNHIEFVVQKERLLKILAEEADRERREGLGYQHVNSFPKSSDGRNGSRVELKDVTATVRSSVEILGGSSSPPRGQTAHNCVDEEKGKGELMGEEGEGGDEESSRLVSTSVSSHGIPLVSLRSLSRQKINFAE